jgi:hypothetical protein
MLKHSRTFLTAACFALVLAALGLIGTFSSSYQKCTSDEERNHSQNKQSNLDENISSAIQIPVFWLCEGKFIDENNGTLTALATIAIAAFTLTLWRATTEQGRLTREAIELGNREFAATHRPRFQIRFERLVVGDTSKSTGNQPIIAEMRLENFGSGDGRVTSSNIILDFFMESGLPHPDDLKGGNIIEDVIIESGGAWRFHVRNKELFAMVDIYEGSFQHLYLIGWVIYEDSIGRQTTYFCRQFDRQSDRFIRVTNSDYERDS